MSLSVTGIVERILNLSILFVIYLMLSSPTFAVESVSAISGSDTQKVKRFGVIFRISGNVTVDGGASGRFRTLHEGSAIYVGEHVRASANGEAVIKTGDAGLVAVRTGADFIPERFAADGKKSDAMILRLFAGSLRVITGWIGHLNRNEHRIITPTATIGIRGTDHEPYVLSSDLANATQYKEGTYDKVNRGKTSLGEGDQSLEIEAGRVGFARAQAFESKGLMTILMPVLLEKVPNFYVPGQFDAELDKLSRKADAESAKQLKLKLKSAAEAAECNTTKIAKNWLSRFDRAVAKRDSTSVLGLFAPDVAVQATVRGKNDEMTTVKLDREELVQSTIAAVQGLKQYKQRRLTLDAKKEEPSAGETCDRISLRSGVIEQGVQSGKPFRFESTEDYLLELRDGEWLAIKAETTQH